MSWVKHETQCFLSATLIGVDVDLSSKKNHVLKPFIETQIWFHGSNYHAEF